MTLGTFLKLVNKAVKFSVHRPLQRFNVYNRAKKYLGPDAKYFRPAPRAIGPMSELSKPIQYPHLTGGNKSAGKLSSTDPVALLPKSFSETEQDDCFVRETADKLDVKKTTVIINNTAQPDDKLVQKRPLPQLTKIDRRDPAIIWETDKAPPGRLSLHMFTEMMLNQLGDEQFWTPKAVAEHYKIREEYAASLIKYLKQIRIVISPRMSKLLDYTARENASYQAAKHLVYHVDKSLRDKYDKQFDNMFLPTDELDEEVRSLLDQGSLVPEQQQFNELAKVQRVIKRPAPLRLKPENAPRELSSHRLEVREQKKLAAAKRSSDSDNVT